LTTNFSPFFAGPEGSVTPESFAPSFSGPEVAAHDIPEPKKSENERMRKKRAALINFGFTMLPKIYKIARPQKMERGLLLQNLKKI
jgi:hypothetical protein